MDASQWRESVFHSDSFHEKGVFAMNAGVVAAVDYYGVSKDGRRWTIVRKSDGHIFCYCRNEEEAVRLTAALNRDCQRDPEHHHAKNLAL